MNAEEFHKGRRHVDRRVTLRAPAKVNLHLEVLRHRHDGYHDIETVLQAVGLYDTVSVTLTEEYQGGQPDITLSVMGKGKSIPADETNLCWQAAQKFCDTTGRKGRLAIELTKEIPAAAGLGGGSSDAAAVLVACNDLFETKLDDAELEAMGANLGADVPFFIKGGTALGRGIGADLTPLPTLRTGQFLIVKPALDLKTPDVYSELKMGLTVNSSKANIRVIRPQLARFPQKTWPGFNRLEDVVLPRQPALQRLVHQMRDLTDVAMLSGSGSAVFGVFEDGQDVGEIVEEFKALGYFVRVVGPHTAGVEITEK
jgi:4-diphosphocytidyl-2-C-methyl-D-erythritol kinase